MQKYYNLKSAELIGMVNFVIGRYFEEYTQNFLSVICRKRNIPEENEKITIDIINLLASNDKSTLNKSFMRLGFDFPVPGIKWFELFIYFKGILTYQND
jgi:hypothetical protein